MRIVYIHIPKAAGTSIEAALGHLDGHAGRGGQDHRSVRMLRARSLPTGALTSGSNLREVLKATAHPLMRHENSKNRSTVTAEEFASYFKFATVRNPWARAFSWYTNVMRDEDHRTRLTGGRVIPFAAFLEEFGGRGALRPQTHWLVDFDGSIPMDYICRFENLPGDFRAACLKAGIPPVELPHALRSTGPGYQEAYDSATRRIIEETYAEEISLFRYRYEDGG